MIEKILLGKTPFGGEIYYLQSDRPYDIPAVRIFVSVQKVMKEVFKEPIETVEEFIAYVNRHPEVSKPYVRKVLQYHHGDIGEMERYGFYIKAVSRLFTFLSWIPIGANRGIKGVGTELSLRYVEHKGFVDHRNGTLKRVEEESLALYRTLRNAKTAKEDARYVLPLSTMTEEIIHIQIGRDLAKWANYLKNEPFEEARAVGEALSRWNEEENGFSMPTAEMPASKMPLLSEDEDPQRILLKEFLADKPGRIHYDPYTQALVWNSRRSIASFHQDVRNRQVYFWWPSWESVIEEEEFYTPPGIPAHLREAVQEHYRLLLEVSSNLFCRGETERAVYATPLGKIMDLYCAIYGNRNIYETVMLRACMRAQLEIRRQYRLIAESIKGDFPGKLGARCETERRCFEPRKELCPLYNRYVVGAQSLKGSELKI
ncbi:hypothetical protein B6U84_01785 [Candidatus Bathyarchaeota archaeon ex4484_40]|nr:MAG: hypothetical protein B6U84_01785 [Candidatus Bathyarchaeota archaeon ex4484_40]